MPINTPMQKQKVVGHILPMPIKTGKGLYLPGREGQGLSEKNRNYLKKLTSGKGFKKSR
jgi:hypothetical protein